MKIFLCAFLAKSLICVVYHSGVDKSSCGTVILLLIGVITLDIKQEIKRSAKWTLLTELLGKLVTPVTGMILARLLDPSAFGVIASILIVTSFAEMFADAGFQKYLVQHEFFDITDEKKCFSVALTTSVTIGLAIWAGIFVFSEPIAELLHAPGLSLALQIAGICVVLNSASGIYSAMFRRAFRFDLLFRLRILVVLMPVIVTIPLAWAGMGYWALLGGTIAAALVSCLFQLRYSPYPLCFSFDAVVLREMASFSLWSLVEAITIWLSTWGGVFVVGHVMNSYYLGLYQNGTIITSALFALVSGPIIPVLFSALSRLQNDSQEFETIFLTLQKCVALILVPMGVGVYVYRDLAVQVMLGSQWHEADLFVGLIALAGCMSVIINNFVSEALRARGMPLLSCLSQVGFFVVMLPAVYYSAKVSFDALAIVRCLCELEINAIKVFMAIYFLHISGRQMLRNIVPCILCAGIMGGLAYSMRGLFGENYAWEVVTMLFAASLYLALISFWRDYREIMFWGWKKIAAKIHLYRDGAL